MQSAVPLAPPPVVLVPGTWAVTATAADRGAWWAPGSQLWRYLEGEGLTLLGARDPFEWSSDLGGVGLRSRTDWKAAASALRWYGQLKLLQAGAGQEISLVAHSHGGAVAAYCAARAVQTFRVRYLVTLGMPVRADMAVIYQRAARRCERWVHVYGSRWRDLWQHLGGGWGPVAAAHYNVAVPGADHDDLLDPALWRARHLEAALRQTPDRLPVALAAWWRPC